MREGGKGKDRGGRRVLTRDKKKKKKKFPPEEGGGFSYIEKKKKRGESVKAVHFTKKEREVVVPQKERKNRLTYLPKRKGRMFFRTEKKKGQTPL